MSFVRLIIAVVATVFSTSAFGQTPEILAAIRDVAAGGAYSQADWEAMASALPLCRYEDQANCVWHAELQGNGAFDAGADAGTSFVAVEAADGRSDIVLYEPDADGAIEIRAFAK